VVSGHATHFDTADALLAFMAQMLPTRNPVSPQSCLQVRCRHL
jgi:hypothetical protein